MDHQQTIFCRKFRIVALYTLGRYQQKNNFTLYGQPFAAFIEIKIDYNQDIYIDTLYLFLVPI
jgi:hypothetical protein